MVDSISGNYFNKWFQQGQNYLSFGQKLVGQDSNPVQNPPVNQETSPVDYQFGQPFAMNVGGVTGPSAVNPLQGVARTESVGYVAGIDGSQNSMGGQGYGFYTVMDPGAGEHSTNGLPRAKHSNWWSA